MDVKIDDIQMDIWESPYPIWTHIAVNGTKISIKHTEIQSFINSLEYLNEIDINTTVQGGGIQYKMLLENYISIKEGDSEINFNKKYLKTVIKTFEMFRKKANLILKKIGQEEEA